MAKNQRQIDIKWQQSGCDTESVEHNPSAGARKSLEIGPHLLPIPVVTSGSPSFTTNVTTATILPYVGANLYVYNNSSTAYSITIGNSSAITAQAIGASDANGNVGVACMPNAWTLLSTGLNRWVIANNASLIVYMVEDPTMFVQQSGPFVQQNVPGYVPPVNS